ncbi:MAG: hypothetical protein HYT42_01600 [Candidatus Sungbacteria bacterium]|nr:hypothetical protein [Candidatus Sungbacteria bacterium]
MTNKLPIWFLRLGLGAMYAYSGYDLITTPAHWYAFVPPWFSQMLRAANLDVDTYLRLQGAAELLFAAVLLAWFMPRLAVLWVAVISGLELLLILVFSGVDLITFRDIGVVGASAALAVSLRRSHA